MHDSMELENAIADAENLDADVEHDGEDVENVCDMAGNASNDETSELPELDDSNFVYKRLLRKQAGQSKEHCAKEERNATIKKVTCILQKAENERTSDELLVLKGCGEIVKEVQSRRKKRDEAKRRQEEFEEPLETLKAKCNILAQAIAQSQHLVIYTGAGISTAARIPDYRGTNGIWTMLQQGKSIGNHDLSLAEPTYTHMALSELYKRNILKYVVSQNCDGLHLRSGLPRTALSEVHGNMYVEVCKTCKPSREYWRLFDVTENTARYSHKTMRKCYVCNGALNDTIVHFGERGSLQWPLNWSGASKNARKATTIVCLGSSLKVLKKYPWLWQMHKPVKRRPNLYIVNLQWTPKDDCANVKIHGKCDLVMKTVMDMLGIQVPKYDRESDPIFAHGTHLLEQECHTTTQPFLKFCGDNVAGKTALEIIARVGAAKPESARKHDVKMEPIDVKVEQNGCRSASRQNHALRSETNYDQKEKVLCKVEGEEEGDDQQDTPINYSKHPNSTADCDTISNIYSIDKVPLTLYPSKPGEKAKHNGDGLPMNLLQPSTNSIWNAAPQAAHSNSADGSPAPAKALAKISQMHLMGNMSMEERQSLLQSTLFTQNCQALLTYYQLSNSLLQSPLGLQAYRDMLYPLQTSWLYSGLHSIINPMPFLTEDNESRQSQRNKEVKVKEEASLPPVPTCEYCFDNYKSPTCVFYEKLEPGFAKEQSRYSKTDNCQKPLFCLCCDYTTEEEDDENIEGVPPDKMSKLSDVDAEQKEKAKIQPGWYGKGYRKNKKNRKKPAAQY